MTALFYDECFQNLYYAEEAMKDWIPVSDYEIIFEAVNPEVQNKLLKNEETGAKSVGFIQKAIRAVTNLITNIINGIKNFFAKLGMSQEEKDAYERFKAELAKDPKLQNKQISVADFRNISKHFDALETEINTEINAVQADPNRSIDSLVSKVTEFIGKDISAAASIVGAKLAVNVADSNIEMAKALSNILDEEKGIMDTLSKNLGTGKANSIKKSIDAAAKNTKLHQLKVWVFRKKSATLQECISKTFKSFSSLFDMGLQAFGNKDLRKTAIEGYKIYRQGNKYIKEEERNAAKNAKAQAKAEKEAEKNRIKSEKEAAKQAKFDEKHKDDPRYKDKVSFITGK